MRGYSKTPYDTRSYELSTNFFIACAEAMGTIVDIDYIDIPNAIVVAIHYTTA
jgi:hypothetical protein